MNTFIFFVFLSLTPTIISSLCSKPSSTRIIGTDKLEALEKFFEAGEKDPCTVDEILLMDVGTIPSKRFFDLLDKTENLAYVTLLNSTLQDFPATARRVSLPHLRSIFLDLNCMTKYTQDELSKVLFFDKSGPWKIETITQLRMEIDVYCREETHFSWSFNDKWLKSEYSFSNEFLKDTTTSNIRILDLKNCDLDVQLVPKNLTYLELADVTLKNGNLKYIVDNFSALLDIVISYVKLPYSEDKATTDFLTSIGVTNFTNYWIAKNNGTWAKGVHVPRKKKDKKASKKNTPTV